MEFLSLAFEYAGMECARNEKRVQIQHNNISVTDPVQKYPRSPALQHQHGLQSIRSH